MPPIPPPDEFGAPAPVWLILLLLYLTFVVHLLVMNFTLAGSLLLPVLRIAGARNVLLRRISDKILAIMPVAVSFTITTGVAPLLFVQVLYGQFFYTANILLGWRWLILLGLLLAGFYWVYWLVGRDRMWENRPVAAGVAGIVPALLFLGIAWIMVNNAVLSIRPGLWAMFDTPGGTARLFVPDPMTLPRFLHMIVGATAVTGLWLAALGWYERVRHGDETFCRQSTRLGMAVALVATLVQMGIGLWLVLAVVVADGPGALFAARAGSVVWIISLVVIVGLLFAMWQAINRPNDWRWTAAAWAAMILVLVGMSAGRQTLRAQLLAEHYDVTVLTVHTQPGPVVLFFVVLAAGLTTVALMLRWCWQVRPQGEQAASGGS